MARDVVQMAETLADTSVSVAYRCRNHHCGCQRSDGAGVFCSQG